MSLARRRWNGAHWICNAPHRILVPEVHNFLVHAHSKQLETALDKRLAQL